MALGVAVASAVDQYLGRFARDRISAVIPTVLNRIADEFEAPSCHLFIGTALVGKVCRLCRHQGMFPVDVFGTAQVLVHVV